MAVDRWFFGGGAEHTPESARRALYASTSGAEGVGGINDLRVAPLSTPGQGVRVLVGSALIKSRYVGGETQTYMGTVYTQETVATTPTGSGGTRADLVVMRVEDPYAAGSTYSAPPVASRATAPYVHIRVISGVPGGTKKLQNVPGYQNDTAITLARINFPASTGTVTAGMITDLREVANPMRSEVVYARPRIGADDDTRHNNLEVTVAPGTAGEYFPGGGDSPNRFLVDVPPWATRMVIDARWMGIYYKGGLDPRGVYWIEYGDEWRDTWPNGGAYEYRTQWFGFNAPLTADNRSAEWSLMDEVGIPAKLRGKTISFVFKAGLEYKPGPKSVFMTAKSGLGCRITFAQRAVDADML